MEKTIKELTTEIVCAYLDAWSGDNKVPTKMAELPDLINTVYNTLKALD